MINLIIGKKGSGKTKRLIDFVNAAGKASNGSVVCVEQERLLTHDISREIRLVETDSYKVEGYDAFYGFLAGLLAGNYDITDVCIDATLKIGGKDFEALCAFLKKVAVLSGENNAVFTFTISADESELPAEIFDFCNKI